MSIIVIDLSPEIFWFASNALMSTEVPLKHITDIKIAEEVLYQELPEIVILNGDDSSINIESFIGKMRNHIFARNIMFVVFTSNPSLDFRRQLVIHGAAQIFYRNRSEFPKVQNFREIIKWLQNFKSSDQECFTIPLLPFKAQAEFKSWGRIGWLNSTECLIECNLDLNPGDTLPISNPLFDELGIKEPMFHCLSKNKVGRYYQYESSLIGTITSRHTDIDQRNLKSWIASNAIVSKNKPVKLVFFEADSNYRMEIAKIIKMDKRYCVRGYNNIIKFEKILEAQLPNLILINRDLILKNKTEFDAIKKYLKSNKCFVITYSLTHDSKIEEYKKDFPFAMHVDRPLEVPLLESMISKLEEKLPKEMIGPMNPNDPRIIFNKHSSYSRISFHGVCQITDLSNESIKAIIPFPLNDYCSLEITSHAFLLNNFGRIHLFRSVKTKKNLKTSEGYPHQLIFIGLPENESEAIDKTLDLIKNPPQIKS
jgi:hypothetical protein